jgi:hypothetical protein
MESLLEDFAKLAQPHALPFRTIFKDHLRRNQVKLLTGVDIISQQVVPVALTPQNAADQQ